MKTLILTLALLMQFPLTGQTLKLNIQPGDTFRSTTTSSQQIVQNVSGSETRIQQKSAITIRYTVRNRTEDELVMDMRFEHIRFEQQSPMGDQVYDSSQPIDNPSPQLKQLSTTYGAMLESKLAIVINPKTGQQIRMEGWDAFLGRVLDQLELTDSDVRKKLEEQLQNSVQDRMSAAGAYGILPPVYGQPIQTGHTWSDQQTVKMMSDMVVDTVFTMESATPENVTIGIASSLQTPADAPPVEMGFARMRYDLTGTQKGSIKIDRKSGWATTTTIEHKLEGKLIVEGQGYAIPMSVNGTIQTVSQPVDS